MPRNHGNAPVFLIAATCAGIVATMLAEGALAGCSGCTGGCRECVPACKGSWDEKKVTKPVYSMKCEYACVRGADSWHAPEPECRCHPPCGEVIVKKKFYKVDGPESVERVPKYEVTMVPVEPEPAEACDHGQRQGCCGHGGCSHDRLGWWNPLGAMHRWASWW